MFRLVQWVMCLLCLAAYTMLAQQQSLPDSPKPKTDAQQGVPDAPQPKVQQPGQFPDNAPPAPKNAHPEQLGVAPTPTPEPASTPTARGGISNRREEIYTFPISVNFVEIPVV